MPVRLIESLATTDALAEVFSDASVLQAMLDFESALARAEARAGVIPESAAAAISASAKADTFNVADLSRAALRAGTPSIPLVQALTEKVRSSNAAAAAAFVHWGATSQDVADTALVLLLKQARTIIDADVSRAEAGLRRLAEEHANTVMLARTLLQPAPPMTFGLKAAGWMSAVRGAREHLGACFEAVMTVQFGGASGTLASLGEKGIAVGEALAAELGLRFPSAPWHTNRERLAKLVCACGIAVGSLGKIARDISLLMQWEVAEVAEPRGEGRGGSSTMPHKRNPIGCAIALAAANRTPGLVAGFLAGMMQEHERGVGGGQAEWAMVADAIQATGAAAASMAEVAEGLTVDAARMRANIESTKGAIFAERAMMLLGEKLGRDVAHKLLEEASRKSRVQGKHLAETLGEMPEIRAHLTPEMLRDLEVPERYLGSAEAFRKRLLAAEDSNKD